MQLHRITDLFVQSVRPEERALRASRRVTSAPHGPDGMKPSSRCGLGMPPADSAIALIKGILKA